MKKATSSNEPEFDYRHYLPAGMETFTITWLARWFGTSPQHWINQIESGAIRATDLRSPGKSKAMMRIARAELIAYLNRASQAK
jgi:hypothetical protein